jgi:hypothetical protein
MPPPRPVELIAASPRAAATKAPAKGFAALLAIVIFIIVGARWRANEQEA